MTPLQAKALAILNVKKRLGREEAYERKRDEMRAAFITDNEMAEIAMGTMRVMEAAGEPNLTDVELQEVMNTVIADRLFAKYSEMAGKGILDVGYDRMQPEGRRVCYKWRSDLTEEENQMIVARCNELQNHTTKAA
jgi:hypothetical protein